MWVNGITVSELMDASLPSHYEMVRRIRATLVEWSPTVFIGFNSFNFDEHFLRQAFYKTLYPPYLTNTKGNSRCDALRLIQRASVFAPDAIVWPRTEEDRRSYKLDQIAPANGFDHQDAHDALADVRATIHICRILRNRAPHLWWSEIRLGRKLAVLDFVETHSVFSFSEFYWGRCYSSIVTEIGRGRENDNDIYVFSLAVNPQHLAGLGEAGLRLRLDQRPKAVRRLRANAGPILSSVEQAPDFAQGLAVGLDELRRRAAFLQSNADLRTRLISAFEANRGPHKQSPLVEEQIYDGFFSDADQRLMTSFHDAPWPDRLSIIGQFGDARLRKLGYQLVHSERPDLLEQTTRRLHDDRVGRRLLGLDHDPRWLTLREAIQQADNILESSDAPHIRDHREFLRWRLAGAKRHAF
jgi:exodeoxyribonuclease-1